MFQRTTNVKKMIKFLPNTVFHFHRETWAARPTGDWPEQTPIVPRWTLRRLSIHYPFFEITAPPEFAGRSTQDVFRRLDWTNATLRERYQDVLVRPDVHSLVDCKHVGNVQGMVSGDLSLQWGPRTTTTITESSETCISPANCGFGQVGECTCFVCHVLVPGRKITANFVKVWAPHGLCGQATPAPIRIRRREGKQFSCSPGSAGRGQSPSHANVTFGQQSVWEKSGIQVCARKGRDPWELRT